MYLEFYQRGVTGRVRSPWTLLVFVVSKSMVFCPRSSLKHHLEGADLDHSCECETVIPPFHQDHGAPLRVESVTAVERSPICFSNSTSEMSMLECGSLLELLVNVFSKSFQEVITVAEKVGNSELERRRPNVKGLFGGVLNSPRGAG